MTTLKDFVLAELAGGTHTEGFADGARWAVQEANKLDPADWVRLDESPAASAQMIQWHAPETAAVLAQRSAVSAPAVTWNELKAALRPLKAFASQDEVALGAAADTVLELLERKAAL